MQAVILAAGMGKRLKDLTQNNTKCMVEVNGVTLIQRLLNQLEKHNLSRIVIVVGYMGKKLIDYINTLNIKTPIKYIDNPVYNKTNNIYSLALAKEYLSQEDTLLFESDLIFEDKVIELLLDDPRDTLALVDKYESWMDGTCMEISDYDTITAFISKNSFNFKNIGNYYKTVNIYKFSKDFSNKYYIPFLEAYSHALGNNEYYEQVLKVITLLDKPVIKAKRLNGELWYEIDDIQDLDIASSMFTPDEDERVSLVQSRYGGYWRYPKLLDFCYLVNPYFPPQKMVDEIQASFSKLLTQYPSGIRVNSLLAAKNFSVHEENIIVGNGAAELIKSLMENIKDKTGFILPTFEEYRHRCSKENSVFFSPSGENFNYTADDVINFFSDKNISSMVIINPDNPTGNYIPKNDILRIACWAETHNITLVVDESFVDFANETDQSLISQEILNQYPNLFIVKSISKSYGVPGLRLGIIASGNVGTISAMKKDVAIWNINSFSEFYMQIEEKYKNDYSDALKKFRSERNKFIDKLSVLEGIKVFPTHTNFVMIRITNGMTSKELTKNMLIKHHILIKDLSSKIKDGEYLRLAIRNHEDNCKLIKAFEHELQ